jgi:hypothetical protein
MELDLADEDLIPIIQIESNQKCNDCGKINPHWCSITNAVLLCPSCARNHKKFNINISKIKSLEVDDWSKEEIFRLKIGGNERFTKLIKSYNIPLTKDNKEYKYYTKAAQYYREILSEELKNNDTKNIKKPTLKEGIEILYQDDYLSLFNKNQSNYINLQSEKNDDKTQNNQEKKNWMDKIIDKLEPDATQPPTENTSKSQKFFDNVTNAFNDVKEAAKEIDFKSKFKKAGEFVQDKTEKIQNSRTFNRFMNAVSYGIDNVIQTTDKFLFKGGNKLIYVPPNYINPNLIPKNSSNYKQINGQNINQNIQQNRNINNINNEIDINKIEKNNNINVNSGANNLININKVNNNTKEISQQMNINNDIIKKEENSNNMKNEENKEEKLDDTEENDPSLLIMSNIPKHN